MAASLQGWRLVELSVKHQGGPRPSMVGQGLASSPEEQLHIIPRALAELCLELRR